MYDLDTQTTDIIKNTSSVAQRVLRQPMTRKEFLAYAGGTVLGLIGIQQFLSVLLRFDRRKTLGSSNQGLAYGESVYGGGKKVI